ncbi:hypothetical protein [Bacillus salipaludis]|uniref:Glycosyltransferase RgtA/B/C/D-like domain-containing protein n=1 Tax=Bacillus salipaludis TaxID=2547811 RepID=A0AA90TTD9_9BACI|nr:hypothetical protein [Bacillus salipaludis]MDQ6597419.1 hypothetical protein [Bacillus salipaludis]
MKNSILKLTLIEWLGIASILIVFIMQWVYLNPFVSSWDQVDFALAVKRFDLMEMQPHFPGYPFFILGGKLMHGFVSEPSQSLTVFTILFYASSLIPLYRIIHKRLKRSYAILSTAIIYSSTYTVIMVNQPMSEGAALASLWWYVWGLEFAITSKNNRDMLVPLVLLSVLLGIRLSYLPFAIGIIYLFYLKVKTNNTPMRTIFIYTIWAVLFQLIWVMGLVISEGSISGFIKLSLAFTSGHFTDWGGAIETDQIDFFQRMYLFIWKNIFWTGTFAESHLTAGIYILLFSFLFRKVKKSQPSNMLFYWLFASYFVWALLAQNIEKARHVLPLVLMLLLFVMIKHFSKKPSAIVMGVTVVILFCQVNRDVKLLKIQATEKPAIYQMNEYIRQLDEPVILYTWEETRVLQYLKAPYLNKRIETYQLFRLESKYYHEKTILLTDKVIEGFKSQGINLGQKVKKLKSFHSNDLFEPIYHDITLYKWIE